MKVNGSSMEPTLQHGALIMVDRARTALRDGWVYVVSTGDGVVVRRARRSGPVSFLLATDNAKWPDEPWPEQAEVVGQCVWTGRHMVALQGDSNR